MQAAETTLSSQSTGGGGLSHGGLVGIIVAAVVVSLSLLAIAALALHRRQVCSRTHNQRNRCWQARLHGKVGWFEYANHGTSALYGLGEGA